jgi:hypothetical protein
MREVVQRRLFSFGVLRRGTFVWSKFYTVALLVTFRIYLSDSEINGEFEV